MPEINTTFYREFRPGLESLLRRTASAKPVQPEELEPFVQEAERASVGLARWCLRFTNQDPRDSLAFLIEAVGDMRHGCTDASQLELIWVIKRALAEQLAGLEGGEVPAVRTSRPLTGHGS